MSKLDIYWHPDIALHDRVAQHLAMHPQRLELIAQRLLSQTWAQEQTAEPAGIDEMLRVHTRAYLERLESSKALPEGEHLAYDQETRLNRHSWQTLTLSAGAWLKAVDTALATPHYRAFCVSYAGHHARQETASGFCFINHAAIAGRHALAQGCQRLAILDIDTHAGDGTVLSFWDEPRVFFAETYQKGFPGRFIRQPPRTGIVRHKVEAPHEFKQGWTRILEKVSEFSPELVLVSAGFDAHKLDPLTEIGVSTETFAWLGAEFGRLDCSVVCGLEGGYNLDSTCDSAVSFCENLFCG